MNIGAKVVVYSFGQHVGTVTGVGTLDGREISGWVKVRLVDGREWNGTVRDVECAA